MGAIVAVVAAAAKNAPSRQRHCRPTESGSDSSVAHTMRAARSSSELFNQCLYV